jgi:5-methylcytosine-specific restriction endonuclease McrA
MDLTKECTQCSEVKALTEFYKKATGRLGLDAECKTCKKRRALIWAQANPENRQVICRKWIEKNPEKNAEIHREYSKRYRKANKESVYAAHREWMKANRDLVNANRRRRYSQDDAKRAKHQEKALEWGKANPDKRRAIVEKYRIRRELQLTEVRCDFTAEQWTEKKRRYKHKCYYCGEKKPLSQDHIVPVSKGGEHTWSNIIPACLSCNARKGTKAAEEFMQPERILI